MGLRGTGLLLLVAGLLGAFVYFYEIRGRPGREQASRAAQRIFSDLEAGDIGELTLASPEAPTVRAARREGGWRILEPVDFPGAPVALDAMARSLAEMPSEGRIENPADDAVYGLDGDARSVRFRAAGAGYSLRVGSPTPFGPNVYVAVRGPGETPTAVHMVAGRRVAAFDRTLDELRDGRLLLFDASQVDRIALAWRGRRAGGDLRAQTLRIALERAPTGWRIVEPAELDADAGAVEGLLASLGRLTAAGYVDDPPGDAEIGLEPPEYELTLRSRGDAGPREHRLAVASVHPPELGLRYVRGSQPSVYLVPEAGISVFPRSVFELRSKQVAHFDADAVRALELEFRPAAGRTDTLRLARDASGEAGSLATDPAVTSRVEELVAALADLEAIGVAAEALGPAEREALGLDPARVEVRVLGSASGGIESVLAELALGDRERGRGDLLAQTAGRSEIYRLDRSLADLLPLDAELFRAGFLASEESGASEAVGADDSR